MVSPPPQTLIPMTKNHLNTSIRRPNRRIASPWLPPKLGQREMVGKKSIYMGDAPLLTPLACRGRPLGAAVWLGVAQGQRSTMGKLLLVLKLKMTMGLYLPQLRRGGGVVELLRRAAAVGGASSSSSSSSSSLLPSPLLSPLSSLVANVNERWEREGWLLVVYYVWKRC